MVYSYLTMTLRLITVIAFPLFLTIPAFAQTSHIIVHTHNPEGIEIASIQGVNKYSIEIFDGNTFIGYGATDAASHSRPITIAAGSHTIKAKFNGMTLEKILI